MDPYTPHKNKCHFVFKYIIQYYTKTINIFFVLTFFDTPRIEHIFLTLQKTKKYGIIYLFKQKGTWKNFMNTKTDLTEKELLSKYYKLRGENVEVTLVYNTFAELVDPNFGDDKVEKLNNKLFDSIDLAIQEIPVKYDIFLNIKIKDFGNYNQEEAIKIIRENIQMRLHTVRRVDKKKKWTSALVMLAGIGIIVASYFVKRSTTTTSIVNELIDLAGQVFVWEGMYAYFLDKSERKLLTQQYRTKLHTIKISKYGETSTEDINIKKDSKRYVQTSLPNVTNISTKVAQTSENQPEKQKKIANIK